MAEPRGKLDPADYHAMRERAMPTNDRLEIEAFWAGRKEAMFKLAL